MRTHLRNYLTCLLIFFSALSGLAQVVNQDTKVYPGGDFWSAFDGPPLGTSGTIYNQNGIVISYTIKPGANVFDESRRECDDTGEYYDFYQMSITMKNTNTDKIFYSRSAPTVSITMEEVDKEKYPGRACDNCACSSFHDGTVQVVEMAPNASVTFQDVGGEFFFHEPEVTKWSFGPYFFNPSKAALNQSSAQRYNALIRAGDSLYNAGERQAAINAYRQALKENGDENYPKQRIRDILDEIDRLAQQQLQLAEQAIAAEDYTTALTHLAQAADIDPSLKKVAKKIRQVKQTMAALKAAAEQKKLSARNIVNDVEEDGWDGNGRHPWDELEEDPITFEAQPYEGDGHAMPDQSAFEQRSRQQAGDLVQSSGSYAKNSGSAGAGGSSAEPNYNSGLCYTLGRKLNRLFKKKYELEQQLNRAMESAAQGNTNVVNRMESITQRYESVSNAIIEINKERYQALKEKRLDPECHQDLIDLQSQYDEQSGANFERSFNNMSRKLEQQRRELGLD